MWVLLAAEFTNDDKKEFLSDKREILRKVVNHEFPFGLPKALLQWEELSDWVKPLLNDVFIVTIPAHLKAYEAWAFSVGIPANHILLLPILYPENENREKLLIEAFRVYMLSSSNQFKHHLKSSSENVIRVVDVKYCKMSENRINFESAEFQSTSIPDISILKDEGGEAIALQAKTSSSCSNLPKEVMCKSFIPSDGGHRIEHDDDDFNDDDFNYVDFNDVDFNDVDFNYVDFNYGVISSFVPARVGLIGNPSDGFFGKTISLCIGNFGATVLLVPNQNKQDSSICIRNSLITLQRASLETLSLNIENDGYYGSERIFLAVLKLMRDLCRKLEIPIPKRGFTICSTTSIPRQVGLAGSSALATALIKCLIKYFEIPAESWPLCHQANLALAAERDELGIAAGHQDRVIQAYGGCVYMDFEKSLMDTIGYGNYHSIDTKSLPKGLWLAFQRQGKDSGKVHRNIKHLFESGDPVVHEGMKKLASLTDKAKDLLSQNEQQREQREVEQQEQQEVEQQEQREQQEQQELNYKRISLGTMMNRNFELRESIYGSEAIGTFTRQMISIARVNGHAAKQSGSGGCIIGISLHETEPFHRFDLLERDFISNGFVFYPIIM